MLKSSVLSRPVFACLSFGSTFLIVNDYSSISIKGLLNFCTHTDTSAWSVWHQTSRLSGLVYCLQNQPVANGQERIWRQMKLLTILHQNITLTITDRQVKQNVCIQEPSINLLWNKFKHFRSHKVWTNTSSYDKGLQSLLRARETGEEQQLFTQNLASVSFNIL